MKEKLSPSSISISMEMEQTQAREFSLHFLATATRLFFFLEIVALAVVAVIALVGREIDYAGILGFFYIGLIFSFLWSIFGITLTNKFSRIRVDSGSISGPSFWGRRKRVHFHSIDGVNAINLLSIKLLRISTPNATLWLLAHLAHPNQFYTAVREAAGPENLLCAALKKLGLPISQPESKQSLNQTKKKTLAVSFGLVFLIISALLWAFGAFNVFYFIENYAPPNVLSGGGPIQCNWIVVFQVIWINFIWSISLLIGVFVPTIMIWKNYDRKSVIVATILGLGQNIFTFLFGIPFLYAACL